MILLFQRASKVPKARVNIIRGSHPSVAENTTAVATIQAAGAGTMTYAKVAGLDAAKFNINSSSGALVFASAPDFETPTDADADNVYLVQISATNDGDPALSDTRTLQVTVTDVAE